MSSVSNWKLYVARGFEKDGRFDSDQIDQGLRLDLPPQLQLTPESCSEPIIRLFSGYLKHLYRRQNLLDEPAIPLKMVSHGFVNSCPSHLFKESIDAAAKINDYVGKQAIEDVIVHTGSIHGLKQEYELRKGLEFQGLPLNCATFGPIEYMEAMEKARANIEQAADYAYDLGLKLLVENVGQIDYGIVPSGILSDKPPRQRKEPRFGDSLWVPEKLQHGGLGCVFDLKYLAGSKAGFCIDIEHLRQSEEYSNAFNLRSPVFRGISYGSDSEEALKKFGVLVRNGFPVIMKEHVCPEETIAGLQKRIPVCHIGGQVDMIYTDKRTDKIGSHMPITFGEQANEFYKDKRLKNYHNYEREKILKSYLKALDSAGCRRGVYEIHVGQYVGSIWEHYISTSHDNVKSLLDGIGNL